MNTFWLKIAGVAVLVVGVIFLISVFSPETDSAPEEPQKTIYDQPKRPFMTRPKKINKDF